MIKFDEIYEHCKSEYNEGREMTNEGTISKLIQMKSDADSYGKKCINKAIEALEYREPMKMIQEEDTAHRLYCGNCHAYFGIYGDILIPSGSKCCYRCGQCIDWRD